MSDAEIDILCTRLSLAATGANIHTANKASCHVRSGFKRDTDRSIANHANLVEKCEAALNNGKWKELDDYMGRWF